MNLIERLKEESRQLGAEIKRLNALVKAKVKRLKEVDTELQVLIKKSAKEDLIVTKYSKELTWRKKIYFALTVLGEGGVNDITDEIVKKQRGLDWDFVYTTVQREIIRLVQELKVIKIGKYKSKYRLNTKGE